MQLQAPVVALVQEFLIFLVLEPPFISFVGFELLVEVIFSSEEALCP
jgi:hypothetical protein